MNMIVCDNNKAICTEITDYIKNNFQFNIFECYNEIELMNIIKSKKEIEVIILDIVLENNINGIDVATEIHRSFPEIKIIFLTGYDDIYYKDIFSTFQPYGFVSKPIQYNILDFFLKKMSIAYKEKNNTYNFISEYKEYRIPIKNINYIQSRKRVCEIVTDKKMYSVYLKISDIENELTNKFIRCHQSYIINLDYIVDFEKSQFTTKNNEYIPISKKYYQKVRERYYAYIRQQRSDN